MRTVILTMENWVIFVLMPVWQKSLLFLVLLTSCSAQSTYYVIPTPDTPCPGEPCHIISQYLANQDFKNLPVNVTIEFLPGNHTLEETIFVKELVWLTLHGDSSSLPEITSRIVCTWPAGFVFVDITDLHIRSLAFISCAAMNISSVQQSNISKCSFDSMNPDSISYVTGGALGVYNSISVTVTDNTFQNNSAVSGGVLFLWHSTLTIRNNTFQDNSASLGGVLYVVDSTLAVTDNTFQNNTATVDGGVLWVEESTLTVTDNTFLKNAAYFSGGVFNIEHSNLTVTDNTFQNNSAGNGGGVLNVEYSTLSFTNNTFQNNTADSGGVLYVVDSTLTVIDNTFQNNSVTEDGGVLWVWESNLIITNNTFQNNSATGYGGVLHVWDSTLTVTDNTFQINSATEDGGVLWAGESNHTITNNTFQNNSVTGDGGVLHVQDSTLTVTDNTFQNNSATIDGGVLWVRESNLAVTNNEFQNNSVHLNGGVLYGWGSNFIVTHNTFQNSYIVDAAGGVLEVWDSILTLADNTFQNNNADSGSGGVLSVHNSTLTVIDNTFRKNAAYFSGGVLNVEHSNLTVTDNTFQNNSAGNGGGVLNVEYSTLSFTNNTFQNNTADSGGVLHVQDSNLTVTDNIFQNNSAYVGGVLHVQNSTLSFTDNTFQNNSAYVGGILNVLDSTLTFTDNIFQSNSAEFGGGITALNSQLELRNTTIKDCTASYGGGLYVHNTVITGNVILTNNSAIEGGGGMYASSSTINFISNSTIMNNSATSGNGGGLLLSGGSQFYLQPNAHVYFISNSAENTGGAIKVEERNPLTYCIHSAASRYALTSNSDCFFQVQLLEKHSSYCTPSKIDTLIDDLNIGIYFDNNSAEAGADLHGGSVDDCTFSYTCINTSSSKCFWCPTSGSVLDDIIISENTPDISSDPLHICTCKDNQTDCTGSYHPESVYPGGTLEVPVIARGQRNGTTAAVIQIITTPNSNIAFQETESIQKAKSICSTIKYTIQSFKENTTQSMTLHAQGPCPPTKSNTLRVLVKILHCPSGFQLSGTHPTCICTKRLQQFTNSCQVDNRTIHRKQQVQFWVGYDNESEGVILHPHCPFDYCTSEESYLAVDDSDKQCNYNRSGLLCGRCGHNLSLALGSSHCLQCSNSYLSLLAAFAFAGIALVVLLLVLRLTVAAGTINGLIFYANIVAVNSATFFQPPAANTLTVFIAWLNLDLGIETCFYNGMDAYGKTWLQFVFPLYVWALIGIIIIGSHYSGRVARVFGSNPIAVLATLFLLSYAKLLRTVIAALSYTFLEYPNNSHIAVWLYDGNIPYLSGKHIPLFAAAMVCLVLLFSPYMMLLVFSQWLQAKSELKILSYINSRYVKPFLDAYHAPYSNKHRYWTGLMLLFRFVLFLISSVNTLGDPSVNLLAIVSATTLILPTILGIRVYKMWSLGLLEALFIINLTILASATLYIHPLTRGNQNAATFTSVGIAFITFIGIVIYHSVQQIKGTRLWRRVHLKHDYAPTDAALGDEDPPDCVFVSGSAPTQTVVDICYHELREPCMATD